MTRFNNETLQVKDFDHIVAIAAFTSCLRDKDFTKSLTKKSPKVFADLILRVEKYINAEKAMAIKYQGHDKVPKEDKKEKYHQRGRSLPRDHNHQQRKRNPRAIPIHTTKMVKKGGLHYHGKRELSNSSPVNEERHTQEG